MFAGASPLLAGFWGLVAAAALLIGATVGYFLKMPRRISASIMAFGAGVLIAALSFGLMEEAYTRAGAVPVTMGFLGGAVVYTAASLLLSKFGGRYRKRSANQLSEDDLAGSGRAIALGALLDGVPESIVLGISMLGGAPVSIVLLGAIFISNFPEGLSSAVGMRSAGRSKRYVFGVWGFITVISGFAAWLGYAAFGSASQASIAVIEASAAGAILAMIADTMIPEAFEQEQELVGLVTVLGFMLAFILDRLGG
ncbi:MAG TPA: ZIP family zinc transporter [Patescibacteria group bacterium]|nr:ZIP family zinc transporter [Patescibacteria group bacterium]